MASLFQFSTMMHENEGIASDLLIDIIVQIHSKIIKLESIKPSKASNDLFSQLLKLCLLPASIDIANLSPKLRMVRESLIRLNSHHECLLELEFSKVLAKMPNPVHNLNIFPYYDRTVILNNLEHRMLYENGVVQPKKVGFIGSGPVPSSAIMFATRFYKSAHFVNFDIDGTANAMAQKIVATDADLSKRMTFKTCDIMQVKEKLAEFDFLHMAALVGLSREDKVKILGHLRRYMKIGGILLVRSAYGARAFLYPAVDEADLSGFKILSVYHPTTEEQVFNTVIVVTKPATTPIF